MVALLLLCFENAHAGRGIPSPYVTKGKHQIFTDGFYAVETDNSSDYRFRERLTTDFGLTDSLGLRLRAIGEQTNSNDFESTQLELSFKYELAEKDEWLVDSGVYVALLKDTTGNDNNAMQLRYLAAKTFPEWRHVADFILQKNFGEELSTTRLGLRFGSLKKLDDRFSLGYQYFGNYGSFDEVQVRDSAHSAGPWLTYKGDGYNAELSLLVGLTDEERDTIIQWRFAIPFSSN